MPFVFILQYICAARKPLFCLALITVAQTNVFTIEESLHATQTTIVQLEREELKSIPGDESTLIRLTSFTQKEKDLIDKRRGDANKLGFVLQLCYLDYTGAIIEVGVMPNANLVTMVAKNLKMDVSKWHDYSERPTTRWEHFKELYEFFDLTPFKTVLRERVTEYLTELATRTDKGIKLARAMVI